MTVDDIHVLPDTVSRDTLQRTLSQYTRTRLFVVVVISSPKKYFAAVVQSQTGPDISIPAPSIKLFIKIYIYLLKVNSA